mmetsp:Transcript_25656/g.83154  ORF Transcript_25656/g.83154 Transcript_25656/m.83154 type:complete len:186 (+) Transcript_25656:129-686(+)
MFKKLVVFWWLSTTARGFVVAPAPKASAVALGAQEDVFAAQREMREAPVDQVAMFRRSRNQLVGDHAFLSAGIAAVIWRLGSLVAAESYVLGAIFGGAYLVLLARYVESVGKSGLEGARDGGVGQARFAIVFLLVLLAGRNRETLDILPLLFGFFTYQFATFVQAARPVDDDEDAEEYGDGVPPR